MHKYKVIIDGWLFTIEHSVYIKGMYKVYWDKVWIGYIYYRLDQSPARPRRWHATTDHTALFVSDLGRHIDASGI